MALTRNRYWLRTTVVLFALLALASLSPITVAAGESSRQLVVRHFVTLPSGLGAEGLVIRDGKLYVGAFSFTAPDGTVLVYGDDGELVGQFTIPGLPQVGQLLFTGEDTLAVVAGNLGTGVGSVVSVNVETGSVRTIATGFKLPNGIAVDRRGNLFVSDLLAGTVSKVTPDGTVSLFASGPLLAPALIPHTTFILGSNDLTFNRERTALYVTNVGLNSVVKISIRGDGQAGTVTKFASVPTPDGIAFGNKGQLFVTSPFTNSLFTISQSGSAQKLPLDQSQEALNNPSNLAFDGRQLFITNLALGGTGTIAVVRV